MSHHSTRDLVADLVADYRNRPLAEIATNLERARQSAQLQRTHADHAREFFVSLEELLMERIAIEHPGKVVIVGPRAYCPRPSGGNFLAAEYVILNESPTEHTSL